MLDSLIVVAGSFVLAGCGAPADQAAQKTVETVTGLDKLQVKDEATRGLAIAQCQALWQQKFALGEDLSSGPCLAEAIITDWSCDVAHLPRTAVDDQPANQCASYRAGSTHHFVELDTSGQLIKAE